MSVQEYLDKHLLSRRIEDAVNAAVRAKTSDPVLFISNHMRKAVPSVITKVKARQILDSRGIPTVEVDLHTNKGLFRASAPSGASSGMYEAIELRDGEKGTYLGNSVNRAVKNINEKISVALVGMDPTLQSQIDQVMIDLDKTENKLLAKLELLKKRQASFLSYITNMIIFTGLGCLSVEELQVSLHKHIADLSGQTSPLLPVPVFTLISGGKHAGNNLAIKEIMILPVGSNTFEEALQMGSETYHHLKKRKKVSCLCLKGRQLLQRHMVHMDVMLVKTAVLLPTSPGNLRDGLDLVQKAIGRTGYNEKIKIAIGVAATEFCIGTKYDLDFKTPNKSGQNFKSGQDMIDMYKELCADYPIASIEDPFDKEDWEHVKYFSGLGICQVVGGDLIMSNPKRIERAIQENSCNSLLLKVPTDIC
ncbi:hypothetical protein H5410_034415 [Solanum commersonii]|uniref:phosphopyruvate hydratase n=1 Tax=Solanum commersonii TaxID=4109 RepID=A0A9J5YT83_SOLCO|nr:hypothetical protein H5410_034415 [Solanum commersonii]